MTTLTGNQVILASWMALRSAISLHLTVPAFNRRNILHAARSRGFNGRTLKQARVWVDEECDKHGLARDAGISSTLARYNG